MTESNKSSLNPTYFEQDNPIAAAMGVLAAIAVLVLVLWFVFSSSDSAENAAQALSIVVM